jgi:branched-chain amino acid transport system permease protein
VPAQQFFAYQFGASQFYLLAYAAIFLIIMLVLPRGILPTITDRLRNRRKSRLSTSPSPADSSVEPEQQKPPSAPLIEEVQDATR